MSFPTLLPLLIILCSSGVSFAILFLGDDRSRLRTTLYLGGEVLKLALVLVMLRGIYLGDDYELRIPLLPGIDFLLKANTLSMLFLVLSAGLWLVTTVYSIGYLRGKPHQSRFFAFFGFSVSATAGIALAGNLFTFFIFFELLTLATYPLIVHRDTPEAMRVGRLYLVYTLSGGVVLLAGAVAMQLVAGSVEFTAGGAIDGSEANNAVLVVIFFLLIAGLAVKNAFVPVHGWLPQAMVAPTPVSALLHGVAVVKAGAFGIVRVVYEVYGIDLAQSLGVLFPITVIASITILYGSLMAVRQDELKKRLAYSTVSQVSYIALGISLFGLIGAIGGVVHLVHQGVMKVTLFLCAGAVAETLGIKHISRMNGVGRRMPWTMGAFALASFGMIGLPPLAGFVSKWHLGLGAMEAGQGWVIAVLIGSTILNAAYFLPIIYRAFFLEPTEEAARQPKKSRFEADWLMLIPILTVALLSLLVGVLAGSSVSPLGWAELIAQQEWNYDVDR
ncbi:monovalent cation/H+ antiporter subunit D family protein [Rubrobacter indicoceani]|uniref:monovalent cation/H+ antiporter subunit D family protein n=1 Tax=Rubrobacter indicoceani TaxID=2051957 RepID=UPI0013C45596|nr:monovalent cation/H+ antiporter subunit D family protein [Rubrobacter indicoceani]